MDVITTEEFQQFKSEFFERMEALITENGKTQQSEWLRSAQVRRLLNISSGTLQTMRINGSLPFKKVGGTMFYNRVEIDKVFKGK